MRYAANKSNVQKGLAFEMIYSNYYYNYYN